MGALGWWLMAMVVHPDVQKRAQEKLPFVKTRKGTQQEDK